MNHLFMQTIIRTLVTCCLLILTSSQVLAQSFMPSPQQIQQFQNLPRAQQEQLARQMGFDLSVLEGAQGGNQSQGSENQPEFVEREVDDEQISAQRARQSVIEAEAKKLKPFGFDLFKNRQEATAPLANTPVPSNYTLGPGDSVKLQLFGKETGSFELVVNNEGNIDLPDLGPLAAVGASFQELKQLVNEKYSQQKIGVTPFISMGQLRSIQVFLVGEVFRPGPLVINSLSTITTALINSGGVSEIGSLRNIELKRSGKTIGNFDFYDLIVYGDTSNDLKLEQGDVIFVPTARNIVSVDGEVRRPAIYEMVAGEDVSSLVRLAGGVLPSADTSAVQLVRASNQNGLSVKSINLSNSTSGGQALQNGDFLRVPKATLEFSNAIKVTGAINLPNIIADTGQVALSTLVSRNTLLANTDLEYALIARRARFDAKTSIIQFTPNDVLNGKFDLQLQSFDELYLFDRFANDNAEGVVAKVTDGNLKTSQDDLKAKAGDSKEMSEAQFLQNQENNRFTTRAFEKQASLSASRKLVLAPLIARLKSEASEQHPVQLIEITGQVKYPGVYPLPQHSSIQTMLKAAGGLTESAHLEIAEITSMVINNGKSEIKHNRVNLIEQLVLDTQQQVKLLSKDVLNVLRIPDWYENNIISLEGEVVFPGVYQISRGETLSSVIKRAGGLTEKASPRAALFTREELKLKERENIDKAIEDLREQLANNNLSNSQFSRTVDYDNATRVLDDLTDVEPVGRMVINLPDILKGIVAEDIELKNGDRLIIPNITPAVSVIGEVFVSTTYRFDQSLTLYDYIERAGGAREFGDTSKIYIVRADGSVSIPRSNYWFSSNSGTVLEPGDTIVVPRDVTNYDNISLWQGVTQILYQSAIAVAAVRTL
ncbi:SLBB domain-containing protein [Glaciecola sp. SC05]|uniref:SLBB domain-containing protein n=1 Tax=Glaciecola sp. SC05 TaxID=1987355 RepID=UPI0035281F05